MDRSRDEWKNWLKVIATLTVTEQWTMDELDKRTDEILLALAQSADEAREEAKAEGWRLGLECSMKLIEPWVKSGTDSLKIYNAVLDIPDDPPELASREICTMTPEQLQQKLSPSPAAPCRHEWNTMYPGPDAEARTCNICGVMKP